MTSAPQEYETPAVKGKATNSELEMKDNTAYGQVQYTIPTDSTPTTTTTAASVATGNNAHSIYETLQI